MYDFITVYDRTLEGASKWLKMHSEKKDVPEGVVPMSVADMEFKTCPKIVEAISHYVENSVLGYSKLNAPYLEAVCAFQKRMHGFHVEPEWIVTTPGIVNALANSVRAFTNRGEGVIVLTPIYPPFIQVVEEQHRHVLACELYAKEGRYHINFEALEELAKRPDAKLLLLCSPHNPGSTVWTKEELMRIGEIMLRNDVLVVSDEIHADMVLSESVHTPYGALTEAMKNRSITCVAASKTYNIAGLQCSSIIIPNEILRKQFLVSNEAFGIERANVLGLIATRAAYELCDDWREEMLAVLRENLRITQEWLRKIDPAIWVMQHDAGMLLWINLSDTKESYDTWIQWFYEANFFVNEGLHFGRGGYGFFRMNIGLRTEDLEANLSRLQKVVSEKRKV